MEVRAASPGPVGRADPDVVVAVAAAVVAGQGNPRKLTTSALPFPRQVREKRSSIDRLASRSVALQNEHDLDPPSISQTM